jgi:hypothetical protein
MQRKWLTLFILTALLFSNALAANAQQRSPNATGLWVGWHECGSVRVGTAALIDVDSMGVVKGIRQFYPTQNDVARKVGSFRISGNFQQESGDITLSAGEWINQPPGYLKCTFVGKMDPSGRQITGNSPGCSCGHFELHRQ